MTLVVSGWGPSLESFSTHLPWSLTSPGSVISQESMPPLMAHASWCSDTQPCVLLVPTLGSRQRRRLRPGAGRSPDVALKELSWDRARLLTLSKEAKSSSLTPPAAQPSPHLQEARTRAHSQGPPGQEHSAAAALRSQPCGHVLCSWGCGHSCCSRTTRPH